MVAIVMGMMTASFGGLIRDVICNETLLIFGKEVYATVAALAAAVHIGLSTFGVPFEVFVFSGIGAGFLLRAAGMAKGLSLPTYKARPGRDY